MASAPFDWFGFQEALSDFGQYVAELKFVDDAYDFLRSPGQNQPAPIVVHTIGRTAPFQVVSTPIPTGDPMAGEYETPGLDAAAEIDHLNKLSSEAATWTYERMADLRDRVDLVIKPVESDFTQAVEGFHALAESLRDDNAIAFGETGFGLTTSKWEGNSAFSFERGFVTPFTLVRENQLAAVAQSAAVCGAAKAVVCGCQGSLMNVVLTMRDTVKQQLEQRAAAQRHSVISADTLTVVSTGLSLVGTLSSLTGAGAGVGAALGIASTAMGYAAGKIPPEDAKDVSIPVAEAEEVMEAIFNQVLEARVVFLKDMNRIGYASTRVTQELAEDEADGVLYPPRPSIDGAGPSDFHHNSSDR